MKPIGEDYASDTVLLYYKMKPKLIDNDRLEN
jgi:hypothetical protein